MKVLIYYKSFVIGTSEKVVEKALELRKAELEQELGKFIKILMIARFENNNYGDSLEVLDLGIAAPPPAYPGTTFQPNFTSPWIYGSGSGGPTTTYTTSGGTYQQSMSANTGGYTLAPGNNNVIDATGKFTGL